MRTTRPEPGCQGERGRVTFDLLDRNLPPERGVLEYFVCGSDAMIHSVEHSLHALGVPMSHCHCELFDLV